MIRIGPFSNALLRGIAFSGFLAVILPSAAQAACLQWDMVGHWEFVQSNGPVAVFELKRGSNVFVNLEGSAWYWDNKRFAYVRTYVRGFSGGVFRGPGVDGSISGNRLDLGAAWQDGTVGVYTGTIDAQGRIQGTTYDKTRPQVTASWYSKQTAKCLQYETIDAQGRVKTETVKPPLPICESARLARARNSPAAPGLEASCRAAGGTP